MHPARRRVAGAASALLVASTTTFVALVAVRPNLDPGALAGNGDDLAFVTAWAFGVACAAWLTLTTLAFLVALLHRRPGIAARIAGFGPPIARRLLQTALVGAFAVTPAAAYATPTAPLVLHVGPGGRLTDIPGDPPNDAPVVRTPPPATTAPRPVPSTTGTRTPVPGPTAPTSTTTLPVAGPLPAAPPTVRSPAAVATTRPEAADRPRVSRHALVVRRGDSLWSIAAAETTRVTGVVQPDTRAIARYWVRVLAANRSTLRSGDPSLIFPGELIRLPDFEG